MRYRGVLRIGAKRWMYAGFDEAIDDGVDGLRDGQRCGCCVPEHDVSSRAKDWTIPESTHVSWGPSFEEGSTRDLKIFFNFCYL